MTSERVAKTSTSRNVRQVLYFDSPREPYRADAVVLACFDARFELARRKLLQRLGLQRPDVLLVAGGPRTLASGTAEERAMTLYQIHLSRRLHQWDRALLLAHSDCGAVGGLAAFDGDPELEKQRWWSELDRASATITSSMGDLRIDCCFMDFARVWTTSPGRSRAW